MSIWTVTERDIYALRGAAGEFFTAFCDSLLRIECLRAGIPLLALATNQRTVKKDGGVDTRMDGTGHDVLGVLGEKTIWQYKATASGDIGPADLEKEVNKPYATELIKQGYAYRLAICDDLPDQTRVEWEAVLAKQITAINAEAPSPKVVTAGHLAAWASEFPAVRVATLGSQLHSVLHIQTWGRNATINVKRYVALADRNTIATELARHVDLTVTPSRVDFIVEGDPGIGKTRLVYEALKAANVSDLVLYTNDDHIGVEMAASLANANSTAVLVIDDCPLAARLQIAELLAGSRERIRVITIQSPEQRHHLRADEMWLAKMSDADVDAILDENFPEVASDRRRSYRELSKGYIRLAVELCRNDTLIVASGRVAALADVAEYLQVRLTTEQMIALQAVAMFHRVGFKDDVADEFDAVASMLSLDAPAVRSTIALMKDAPGFVAEGGRYYYVTPTVIADVAFHLAWRRWAQHEPQQFLSRISKLPTAVLENFLRRVSISANQEVGRVVGDFFRELIIAIQPEALAHGRVARLLSTLVEADASANLPLLRGVIERSTSDDLTSQGRGDDGWAGRRHLVWLCERLARFPEYFKDAEAILWILAQHEIEPGIGNNATAQWQQLFRIFLSGTATPFVERLTILRERVLAARETNLGIVVGAVAQVFNEYPSRTGGSVHIGGRPAPQDWQPQTYGEVHDAQRAALRLLQERVTADPASAQVVLQALVGRVWTILYAGVLSELRQLVASTQLMPDQLLEVLATLREFADRNKDSHETHVQGVVRDVREWVAHLTANAAQGQLLALLSVERYVESGSKDEEWRSAAKQVAANLAAATEIPPEGFALLNHANPYRAYVIGHEVGQCDRAGKLLDAIVVNAIQTNATAFAAGYASALSTANPDQRATVNATIDRLEVDAPSIAFELARALGANADHFQRTLAQVQRHRLPVPYIKTLMFGVSERRLVRDEIALLMDVLLADDAERPAAATVGLEILAYYLHEAPSDGPLLDDVRLLNASWRLAEGVDEIQEAYIWADVAKALAAIDVDRAIELGMRSLARGDFGLRMYAEPIIAEIAASRPADVIRTLLRVLSADELPVGLLVGTVRDVVAAIPPDVAREALKNADVKSVRRFARHLSPPFLADGRTPVVPELTLVVLTAFEDDDEVFNSFYAGTHSFRSYMGDIARQHEHEAFVASKFLQHPAKRIRQWAAQEIADAKHQAKYWRDRNAEELSQE